MPRPRKWRKVCCLPQSTLYGPLNGKNFSDQIIIMTVDEYESIRLIDLERLTQEECAERMNVARATVQKIYTDARTKIAESLVNGNLIKIEGGDYELYDDDETSYCCNRCKKSRCMRKNLNTKKENGNMEGE